MLDMVVNSEDLFSCVGAHYTPGIYADGYIVFAFPFVRSYVRWFVRSFVRSFVSSFVIPERSWNLCQSFC